MVPQGARAKDVHYWQAQEAKERENRRQPGSSGKHTASGDGRGGRTTDSGDGGRGDNDECPVGGGEAGGGRGELWESEKEEVRAITRATSRKKRRVFGLSVPMRCVYEVLALCLSLESYRPPCICDSPKTSTRFTLALVQAISCLVDENPMCSVPAL